MSYGSSFSRVPSSCPFRMLKSVFGFCFVFKSRKEVHKVPTALFLGSWVLSKFGRREACWYQKLTIQWEGDRTRMPVNKPGAKLQAVLTCVWSATDCPACTKAFRDRVASISSNRRVNRNSYRSQGCSLGSRRATVKGSAEKP